MMIIGEDIFNNSTFREARVIMKLQLGRSLLLVAAVLVMSGCASEGTPPQPETAPPAMEVSDSVTPGIPEGWEDRVDDDRLGEQILTGWIDEGKTFAVVTWGSSSCVPIANSIEASSDASLLVKFVPSPSEVCTADMAPATHTFTLPDTVTQRPVTLTVEMTDPVRSDTSVLE